MTKRYLTTPEEVTAALKEGKVVLDRTGNKYKSINGFIVVSFISGEWGVDPFIGNHEGLYVEEPKPLKLEVGKFYKTRDGRKAFVYTITEEAAYPCWVVLVNSSEGISVTQRYKCIGNGWTVDVIAHIFGFIKEW